MSAIQGVAVRGLLLSVILALGVTDIASAIASATCSSGKKPAFIIDPVSLGERDVFNVRFKKIDVRGCKIWDVVVLLAEEIEKSSNGKRRFEVGLESSRAERSLDQRVPTSQWDLGGPKIKLVGSNMTVEAVIDTLCLQAGWSYDDHTPVGTMFTDSKRFPKPK